MGADEKVWSFITTKNEHSLEPILEKHSQPIQQIFDKNGRETGEINHILRVFLIDKNKEIRNIYTNSFLHKDIVLSDIKTLLLENDPNMKFNKTTELQANSNDYGKHQQKYFFDRRLSLNSTISCAMCHIPEHSFANNQLATAVGIEGKTVRRNAPTIYNVAYMDKLFYDAREDSLELQVWTPMLAKNEMSNPSFSSVINKIKQAKDYKGLFEQAFDGDSASITTIGRALASYQRTLISANSSFDKWHYAGDKNAMSAQAQLGFKLFSGKASCAACHSVNDKYALFMDNKLHNIGIGYADSTSQVESEYISVQLAPDVFVDVSSSIVDSVSEPKKNDIGLYEVTEDPKDRWKYKTSSLRNIALTAPYMHNGSLSTLKEVVEFYNKGGVKNEVLSPLIRPLHLNKNEVDALVTFLKSLTGDNVNDLVENAFSAPIGDTTENFYH